MAVGNHIRMPDLRTLLLLYALIVGVVIWSQFSTLSPIRGWINNSIKSTVTWAVHSYQRRLASAPCEVCPLESAQLNGVQIRYPSVLLVQPDPIRVVDSPALLLRDRGTCQRL